MAKLSLCEIAQSQLSSTPVKDGQIVCALDTGNFYRDTASGRVHLGHEFEPVEALPLAPIANKIYLLRPDKLYVYDQEWVLLNTKNFKLQVANNADNGNVKIKLDCNEEDSGLTVMGSGVMSVTTNGNGSVVISSSAEENQNAFSQVKSGDTVITASAKNDAFEISAGENVTIQAGSNAKNLTISAKDTTYNNATEADAGLMSPQDKIKLNAIEAGANKTIVDAALSSTSENPVQNKVVQAAVQNLTNIVGNTPIPQQVSDAIEENAVQVDLNGAPAGDAATNNADTLGGKTLAQIEDKISLATVMSTSRTWTVTVPESGWVAGSLTFMGITCGYKNVVSVVGMTSDVSIDLVKYNSGDVTAARSYICQDTGNGTITFWAKSALATFSVKLTEVR